MPQVIWEENSKGGTINVCEMLRVNLLLLRLLQDLILALVFISASEDPNITIIIIINTQSVQSVQSVQARKA